MTDIVLIKAANGALIPGDPQAAEYIAKLKMGGAITASVKRHRNPAFHRKFFSLLNLAFDSWEPEEKQYKGVAVQKQFDQFRKDVTILAGYYDTSITLKGDVRLTAKSISFGSMDEAEFDQLYNAVINVVLSRILTKYTREDLDRVVEQILGYAS